MQLLSFLSTYLALASTTTIAAAAAAKPKSTKTSTSSYSYLLQTHVINGGRKDFDGLYVQAYHTGAGLNDVTLGKGKNSGVRGQLSKGTQYFDLGDYPATFFLPEDITYDGMLPSSARVSLGFGPLTYISVLTAWYPVRINGGVYDTDLFLNSTGLQWTETHSFGGWLGRSTFLILECCRLWSGYRDWRR